ncbi:hypothetical protein KAK07_14890 [Ideonella sp. 4Y16]|uniref:Uncharacterized protein n=1 Tax=Ideonella alba TaxID=2824118 RepID=A0A941BCU4_9BURK|nr:hypothetical protein [Ideonella alba]MBQ0929521.1 hypothetical protein [Ideonella alba]MBQ0944623.1 hypothetical protein [Ideonella alba]
MKTHQVFGIQSDVVDASYIDRGALDSEFRTLVDRGQMHIAIRGASKCGKSWLRKKVLDNPIVVQCRLSYTTTDVYRDALAALGVRLEVDRTVTSKLGGKVGGSVEGGFALFAKASASTEGTYGNDTSTKEAVVGRNVTDLRFISDTIRESGRKLVIEDFHYLPITEQQKFAFDLKTLWDYKTLVVVVGVWIDDNMLITLNSDLADRIEELPVTWSEAELKQVFTKGCAALSIRPTDAVSTQLAEIAYQSVGLLQKLALRYLDELKIYDAAPSGMEIELDNVDKISDAAMHTAEQLNQLYQSFAKRVCEGVRQRKNATGIYAHALKVIMEATDGELLAGIPAKDIYRKAHAAEPRVQLPNLRSVLAKFAALQVDQDGRSLVLAYDGQNEKISLVDRQLLLYRRFATVKWPWEDLIAEVGGSADAYD